MKRELFMSHQVLAHGTAAVLAAEPAAKRSRGRGAEPKESAAEKRRLQRAKQAGRLTELDTVLRGLNHRSTRQTGGDKLQRTIVLIQDTLQAVRATTTSLKLKTQSHQPQGGLDWRAGLLSSSSMGVLMVRVADFEVVESSRAFHIFCANKAIIGYEMCPLKMCVHHKDVAVLKDLQDRVQHSFDASQITGKLRVRLLRVCQEASGSFVCARYVWQTLEVAHVSTDRASLILQVNFSPDDLVPLQAPEGYWKRHLGMYQKYWSGRFEMEHLEQGGFSLLDLKAWHAARGLNSVDCEKQTSLFSRILATADSTWHAITATVQSSLDLYVSPEVGANGLPLLQIWSQLKLGENGTGWQQCINNTIDGKLFSMGRVVEEAGQGFIMQIPVIQNESTEDDYMLQLDIACLSQSNG
mmetsp:Transcript_24284/g.47122  ORF Transcript_24284/g.47122 Transcript_24284/m.47122 type:complete len:411 (+) Transcript_24284:126-1358(+)